MASPKGARHLTLAEIIGLHQVVMERTGSSPAALRDEGLLESAVTRPHMAAFYEEADLVRQCALLMVGITQAQAFFDGNKRTAFAAGRVFLRLNGLAFQRDPLELAYQLEAVATREGSVREATDRFERWLRERMTPLEPCALR